MENDRIHRATSSDGTEIAGRVQGQGPPLVVITGTGDGEGRQSLPPFLDERLSCHCISLRGRGLSGDHPDHTPERLVEDISSFIDSIGEPVAVEGHSRGAALAVEVAARSQNISAVAAYEPHAPEFYGEQDVARVQDALSRMRDAANDGRVDDAARTFLTDVALASEQDMAIMSSPEAIAPLASVMPAIIQDIAHWDLPRDGRLPRLEDVAIPVLLVYGSESNPFYPNVVEQLAARLPQARVKRMDGLGHFGPVFAPKPVANEFLRFFAEAEVAA